MLQPGAVFILEYANKQNLKAILRYWLGRQSWSPFTLEPVEFAELNFDFHPKAVRMWLEDAGFSIERQLTVSHYRMDVLKRWVPLSLLVKMDAAAQLTGDWWQVAPSVFLRSRALPEGAIAKPGEFFCCPECGAGLAGEEEGVLTCRRCMRRWSYCDGIYDFREPLA